MNAGRPTIEWLVDARDYAREARVLAGGMNDEPPNRRDMLAIRYCLLVIGEALDRVPSEFLAHEPDVPWRKVIALRHRLAHGYWLVDEEILIQVARYETDPLVDALGRLIGSAQ